MLQLWIPKKNAKLNNAKLKLQANEREKEKEKKLLYSTHKLHIARGHVFENELNFRSIHLLKREPNPNRVERAQHSHSERSKVERICAVYPFLVILQLNELCWATKNHFRQQRQQ